MITIYIVVSLLILYTFYKRYVPVHGVRKLNTLDCSSSAVSLVDVRHFHEMTQQPCQEAIHIPLPYLARQSRDIPSKEVVVIASDSISRNLGIRQLKKNGFTVKGYWCA